MTSGAYSDFQRLSRERPPIAALVLGSGLNRATEAWNRIASLRFEEIPGLAPTSVSGHRGELGLFDFRGERVLVFHGRLHFYEGHSWETVEQPVRIARELGACTLLLTNASGGIRPRQEPGTLMAIRDQIAANRPNWWRLPGLGGAAPPSPSPYSPRLLGLLQSAAGDIGLNLHEGAYAAVTGPCYETPAEIRALRSIGADAVGMSTVHEANVALSLGMEVAGVSCIANWAAGLSPTPLSHAEVLAMVTSASGKMTQLLNAFLVRLGAAPST